MSQGQDHVQGGGRVHHPRHPEAQPARCDAPGRGDPGVEVGRTGVDRARLRARQKGSRVGTPAGWRHTPAGDTHQRACEPPAHVPAFVHMRTWPWPLPTARAGKQKFVVHTPPHPTLPRVSSNSVSKVYARAQADWCGCCRCCGRFCQLIFELAPERKSF